jgi:lysophospholipase L1-like esterase
MIMTTRSSARPILASFCIAAFWLGAWSWSAGCADPAQDDQAAVNAPSDAAVDHTRTSASDAAVHAVDAGRARVDPAGEVADDPDDDSPTDAGVPRDGGPPRSEAADAGLSRPPTETSSDAGARDAGPFPTLPARLTLHIAGDSTAAIFPASDPTHRVGWAAVLQSFFATGVEVDDAAQSGRSSKSYLDEGLWKALKAKIEAGDYVFVEFGHNDEKSDDAARYTNPATTFRTNLELYVKETRAAGGVPVLLTPISRRQFSGSKIAASHGAYPAAVVAVGTQTNTPVIDMTERTRVWLESLGPTSSVAMFATDDNTHLSAKGAEEVAKLAVQGIRALGLPLAERLAP